MKALLCTSLCAVILFSAACSDDDSTTPTASTSASDYWLPAAAGSRTVFDQTDVSTVNGVRTDSTVGTVQFTMLAGTKTTSDSKTASTLQVLTTSDTGVDTTVNYLVASAAAIIIYEEDLLAENATTILKAPLTVGSSWISHNSTAAVDSVQFTIASVTETVATPAGTFQNCIHARAAYQHSLLDMQMTQDIYFAKGVGLVLLLIEGSGTVAGITASYKSETRLKSKSF